MTNHIPHPSDSVSRKETWAEDRRARFETELLRLGWIKALTGGERFLNRQMPDERRFVKGNKALMVDDFGAFAYEFMVYPGYSPDCLDGTITGVWRRILGISDDEIDKSPQGYLHFCDGPKLDLKMGEWVK